MVVAAQWPRHSAHRYRIIDALRSPRHYSSVRPSHRFLMFLPTRIANPAATPQAVKPYHQRRHAPLRKRPPSQESRPARVTRRKDRPSQRSCHASQDRASRGSPVAKIVLRVARSGPRRIRRRKNRATRPQDRAFQGSRVARSCPPRLTLRENSAPQKSCLQGSGATKITRRKGARVRRIGPMRLTPRPTHSRKPKTPPPRTKISPTQNISYSDPDGRFGGVANKDGVRLGRFVFGEGWLTALRILKFLIG
jgi:hypothetical protein